MYGIYLRGAKGREKLGEVTGPDMMRALHQAVKLITEPDFDLDKPDHQPTFRASTYTLVNEPYEVAAGLITWRTPYLTEVDVVDTVCEDVMLRNTEVCRLGGALLTGHEVTT